MILDNTFLKNVFNNQEVIDPLTGYAERPVSWFEENIIPELLQQVETLGLGQNILEVGCAHGYFSKVLAKHFEKVTSIDFSITRIHAAIVHNHAPNIRYIYGDIVNDKIVGQYDWAVSSAVFQHINPLSGDRAKAFKNVFQAIKPGGYLVLYDEAYETRNYDWEGFYQPLSPDWIKDYLSDTCELEDFAFICRGGIGEYEYRWILKKL